MPAEKISLNNAKEDKLFYFVANAVVYRESDGRCLILKRSEREKVHPGKYCVPGGKLEWQMLDIKNPTRFNGDVLDFEDTVENLLWSVVFFISPCSTTAKMSRTGSNSGFVLPNSNRMFCVKFGNDAKFI